MPAKKRRESIPVPSPLVLNGLVTIADYMRSLDLESMLDRDDLADTVAAINWIEAITR